MHFKMLSEICFNLDQSEIVWSGNGKSLNSFPDKPLFLRVCSTSLLKTLWEKEKLLLTSNFYFFQSVFYLFGELSAIFIKLKIVICKLLEGSRLCRLGKG